ncbi:MAG: protoporphyrinogen/coproporphyrinogen oxidase [Myxococcota bacterium]
MKTKYLVIGAGMSGLAFANFIDSDDYLVLEQDSEVGGWCKTVKQDGFVWDYSGHFFHFKHPEIEAYLRDRMPDDEVSTVVKNSKIIYDDAWVDFPFQKNIHQLPKDDFVECLYDLYFRDEASEDFDPDSFKGMLYEKFGRGISEKFLVPYNEKLYACDLEELDRDAMGRFFPYADLEEIIRNMREPDNQSYNATFTYPKNGAIMYVNALLSEVPNDQVLLNTRLERLDLDANIAHTSDGREIEYEHVISSAPFDALLNIAGFEPEPGVFSYNRVLVFNLGFDRKGPERVHWIYFPERKYSFYRVGFYDNIMEDDRMSLYVEIGYPAEGDIDVAGMREQVLADLRTAGVVDEHELVSDHTVTLDPAYVHITQDSTAAFEDYHSTLNLRGVHSIGRYGGWTYCSIEDNIVEARALARKFNRLQALD